MIYTNIFDGIELPDTLTDEQFNYYFSLFKSGSVDARDILINSNIRLVVSIVKKDFGNTDYEMEELVSIGGVGLIKAIDSFDYDKNKKISTYATTCIRNEILMYIRKEQLRKGLVVFSLDMNLSEEKDSSTMIDVFIDVNSDSLEEVFINDNMFELRRKIILEIINSLEEKEKKIIMMKFGFYDGVIYRQTEIAKIMNLSISKVRWIMEKTLRKIERSLIINKEILGIEEDKGYNRKLVKH